MTNGDIAAVCPWGFETLNPQAVHVICHSTAFMEQHMIHPNTLQLVIQIKNDEDLRPWKKHKPTATM